MAETTTVEGTSTTSNWKLLGAFTLVLISYVLGFWAGFGIIVALKSYMHIIFATLIADIAATIVVFIFSVIFNNVSFYDPYWSVQPIVIAIYWMLLSPATGIGLIRQVVIVTVVSFWGFRLTINWIRGWKGLKHEDWRYVKYREDQPKLFWFIAFTGLEMMPTLIVFLGCVALYPALVQTPNAFSVFDIIGIVIAVGATLIEFIADEQMKIFVKTNENPKRIMDLGLWGVSRHPNYFGEISFWWGIWFFALGSNLSWWWTVAGPVAMVILFVFVSIPLMENRQIARKPEYREYKKKVSALIPWFPRR